MPIKFACISPHPPILIPSIGKENLSYLEKTTSSLNYLAEVAEKEKIDTYIIISPHGSIQKEFFTLNVSPRFIINFEKFGDFSTKFDAKLDTELAYSIKEKFDKKNTVKLISKKNIDHGSGVPLYFIANKPEKIKIIPIYYSGLTLEENFNFGKKLEEQIRENKKNIGIIASGDLSHRLNKKAPAGYSPRGAKFDKKLIELLKEKKSQDILNLDKDLINEAAECGLRSIAILLGMLNEADYTPELLSYEGPFGVGYLTMNFNFNKIT